MKQGNLFFGQLVFLSVRFLLRASETAIEARAKRAGGKSRMLTS